MRNFEFIPARYTHRRYLPIPGSWVVGATWTEEGVQCGLCHELHSEEGVELSEEEERNLIKGLMANIFEMAS